MFETKAGNVPVPSSFRAKAHLRLPPINPGLKAGVIVVPAKAKLETPALRPELYLVPVKAKLETRPFPKGSLWQRPGLNARN